MSKNKNGLSAFKVILIIVCAFSLLFVLGSEFFTIVRDTIREGPPLHIERAKIEFGSFVWVVLYENEDKKLVITEEIITQLPYQTDSSVRYATWETSSIRQFLNDDFLQKFTFEDRGRIVETYVKNSDNLWFSNHGSTGGNNTLDKVFLLSLEEVDRYFGNSGDYLNQRGWVFNEGLFARWVRLDDNDSNNTGTKLSTRYDTNRIATYNGELSRWWLRSPGILPSFVAIVWEDGAVNVGGESFITTEGYRINGIRPALWLYSENHLYIR